MVKDNRHRTRGLTTGSEELALPMVRSAFTLVTNIQDEVHRYAIAYQRTLHRRADTASQLKSVKGIGDVKLKKLLSPLAHQAETEGRLGGGAEGGA